MEGDGMTRLNSSEIIKVLDNLIGETTAVGDTWADEKREENLKTLIDITNWCLDGVHQSSETMGRPENSMHEMGFRARQALMEYHRWLGEVLEEGEQ